MYCSAQRYLSLLFCQEVPGGIVHTRGTAVHYVINKYQSVLNNQEVPECAMLSRSTTIDECIIQTRGTAVYYVVVKYQSVLHSHEVPERNVLSRSTRVYCTTKRYHKELCCQEVQRECIVQTRGTGAYRAVKHYQRVLFSRGTRDYFTTKKYRNVFYNQEVPERIVLSKCQPSLLC